MIQSLTQEKSKIIKQNEHLNEKIIIIENDIELLNQFNQNLELNSIEIQKLIQEERIKVDQAELIYRQNISPLEQEVERLMNELDSKNKK